MLDLTRVQGATVISELPLATGVVPAESGLAYVRVNEGGLEVVKPSTGIAGEKFVGVAYLDKHATVMGTRVNYSILVPSVAPYIVTLPDTLSLANIKVATAAGVVLAAGVDYTVASNQLTFIAAHAGASLFTSYNYTLTETQKSAMGVSPIASAATLIGKLALLQGFCRVFVSNFEADAAWDINADVTLGADGVFTVGGLGTVAGSCFHIPTASDPFLGLEYTN